jgi:hypothetical protein
MWAVVASSAGIEVILKPNCRDCKWFIASNNYVYEPGRCGYHTSKIEFSRANVLIHKYAIQCRLNDELCGMNAKNFQKKEKNEKNEKNVEISKLRKEIEDIEINFNGEIYEKNDIKNLEEEIATLKAKIEEIKNKTN